MKHIPTSKEPKALKAAYLEAYGDSAYEYKHNHYDMMELRLLNDAHEKRFGDGVSIFMAGKKNIDTLNAAIRRCLKDGTPYEYALPKGAIA